MNLIKSFWYRYTRWMDLKFLWPQCRKHASSLDHAKSAFASHAFIEPAWVCLGEHEIKRIIDGLK